MIIFQYFPLNKFLRKSIHWIFIRYFLISLYTIRRNSTRIESFPTGRNSLLLILWSYNHDAPVFSLLTAIRMRCALTSHIWLRSHLRVNTSSSVINETVLGKCTSLFNPLTSLLIVITTPTTSSFSPHRLTSSPNFQLMFHNALKSYEKRTKNDLVAHPLAAQLQACDSPGAILIVLQQQVRELDQPRTTDERWTRGPD
jgi:hypothetical protein